MSSEIHLFIVWEKARDREADIQRDLLETFELVKMYEIYWDDKRFAENLSRFYGKNLPPDCRKEYEVGTGAFLLYVVRDNEPIYDVRKTTKGPKLVNIKTFDAKIRYRELTKDNGRLTSSVHATNDIQETRQDVVLLTGTVYDDFLGMPTFHGIQELHGNLVGADGWDNLNQLFTVVNESLNYVILRNYQVFFEQPISEEHTDIDLLVESYTDAQRILIATPTRKESYRVQNWVLVDGLKINFDLRSVGDNYYDANWEKQILRNRIFNAQGFFVPSCEDNFFSLIYHAVIQKQKIAPNYIDDFMRFCDELMIRADVSSLKDRSHLLDLLECYLAKYGFSVIRPTDQSVGYFVDKPTYRERIDAKLWMLKRKVKRRLLGKR